MQAAFLRNLHWTRENVSMYASLETVMWGNETYACKPDGEHMQYVVTRPLIVLTPVRHDHLVLYVTQLRLTAFASM